MTVTGSKKNLVSLSLFEGKKSQWEPNGNPNGLCHVTETSSRPKNGMRPPDATTGRENWMRTRDYTAG